MRFDETKLAQYLDRIRALDFVKGLELGQAVSQNVFDPDGLLTIVTPKGKFSFGIEQKGSYLDRTLLHAIIGQARSYKESSRRPLLLLARYIPRLSAERLIEHGVNFVDRVGNMHLVLGGNYTYTVIGKKETTTGRDAKTVTPAVVQLLFTFAACSQAQGWSVRDLAKASGVSKSNVANIRHQLTEKGLLQETRGAFKIRDAKYLEQELLRGYGEVLRPKLVINRFRAAESSAEIMLERIAHSLAGLSIRWSLTGGPAAYEFQHFYRGTEIPIFINAVSDTTARHLRLLPDVQGPIIFLRSFGTVPYWKEVGGKMLAHPWLIYAELMHSPDPRAHEAAEELKGKFLT
ncbi:MAG: type IV toxin-antitoxin system AbiEi family antitoxin [Acidobacteriota bacterium]